MLDTIDVVEMSNIDDLINSGINNALTTNNTNFWAKVKDIVFPNQNVFRAYYRPLIMRYCQKINLSDALAKRYRFRPKTLSHDLYGTVDLWHIILWLNNLTTVTEFNLKSIVVLNPGKGEILVRILENEEENLTNNNLNPMQKFE